MTQQQREEVAARIRAEMGRQGMTNSKLARKADLSEKTISRVINARKEARYDTLERIAKALGISEADLRGAAQAPLGLRYEARAPQPNESVDERLARIEQKLDRLLLDSEQADARLTAREHAEFDRWQHLNKTLEAQQSEQAPPRSSRAPRSRRASGESAA